MVVQNVKTLVLEILLVAAGLWAGLQYTHGARLERQLSEAQQEIQVLSDAFQWAQADRKALASRLTAQSKLEEKKYAATKVLQEAVVANPVWSEQPVPAAVLDSLRD